MKVSFVSVKPLQERMTSYCLNPYIDRADELNIKGIRTVRGTKISLNTVMRMLHNRRYIGEYQYRDVVVPNGVPAIVPAKLFEQVQERAVVNKKAPAKHKAEDEYFTDHKVVLRIL